MALLIYPKKILMAKTTIKNRYGTAPNELLNNSLISLRAKGLFTYIQSKPEDWDFSVERIKTQTKESADAIISAIKELEEFGYLLRRKYQNDKGHWGVEYILFSEPTFEIPVTENPIQEIPCTGKTPNNSKKDLSKKDNSNKEEDIVGIISRTIDLLNLKSESKYSSKTKKTVQSITSRLNEGFTETDLSLVVVSRCDKWLKDPKMSEYLRPETLFGNKFEGYLNESLRAAAKPKSSQELYQERIAAAAATSEFNQKSNE